MESSIYQSVISVKSRFRLPLGINSRKPATETRRQRQESQTERLEVDRARNLRLELLREFRRRSPLWILPTFCISPCLHASVVRRLMLFHSFKANYAPARGGKLSRGVKCEEAGERFLECEPDSAGLGMKEETLEWLFHSGGTVTTGADLPPKRRPAGCDRNGRRGCPLATRNFRNSEASKRHTGG
jgi:hypothetical protein